MAVSDYEKFDPCMLCIRHVLFEEGLHQGVDLLFIIRHGILPISSICVFRHVAQNEAEINSNKLLCDLLVSFRKVKVIPRSSSGGLCENLIRISSGKI